MVIDLGLYKKSFLRSAHFTWISLVVMIIAMVVMMMGFQQAGIEFKEGSEPPKSVPPNVIVLAGYAIKLRLTQIKETIKKPCLAWNRLKKSWWLSTVAGFMR